MKKKTVAIIGSNGIPASYGGFEVLAENLVKELTDEYSFIVYCSKTPKKKRISSYFKARLIYLPLRANGWQSVFYDIISTFHAWFVADSLLILGPVAGFILPLNLIFRKKIIVNHGGLNEWEREKYNYYEKRFIRINFKIAAKFAMINIADNILLKESIYKIFNKESIVIRYGGDHAIPVKPNEELKKKYPFLSKDYFVSVSRAQVDNNLHILLETFSKISNKNLVLISNWSFSDYGCALYNKYYNSRSNIFLLNAIYNPNELNCLRSNAVAYIHSHSRCGTSPSLIEAIALKLPVLSFDMPTNRETMNNQALFFKNSEGLLTLIKKLNKESIENLQIEMGILRKEYLWKKIAGKYAKIL